MTNEQRVLDYLRSNGESNSATVAAALGLTTAEVARIMLMLCSIGLVRETKTPYYYEVM